MKIVRLTKDTQNKILSMAERILRSGGIVVGPTDTVYGVFGNAARHDAIEKIFATKGRNPEKALPVFVKDINKLNYLELFNKITNILDTDEVDLIILNTAPISLIGRILQNRKILIDKNPFLRHKYESINLRKYFDFKIKEYNILKRRYGIGGMRK